MKAAATATGPALVDRRRAFLLRASTKFELVEAALQDADEAIDDLEHALHMLRPCCTYEREMVERWERWDRERGWDRQRRQQWRRR
jgi:hypothetical protein